MTIITDRGADIEVGDWACPVVYTENGAVVDGCDLPATAFDPQSGRWFCENHADSTFVLFV